MASASKSRRKSAGDRSLPPIYSGPWKSVRVINGAPLAYGDTLLTAQNLYCPAPGVGAWHSRPSVARVGSAQLGSGSTRNGQRVYEHTRPDGTIDRFFFAGGKLYSWNGTTTFTDITPGAVTISTTARVYCATFAGLLIVSDGVNKPWTYNPATTTATYIDIDGGGTAWFAYGAPVVYGAKLFFILASKGGTVYRSTITWSEEVSPATGYYQATFTNFWTLTQTADKDPRLFGLAANNTALFFFRAAAVGAITGTVNPDFATASTHDAVSSTIGTMSPASIINVDEDVYFLDRYLRQCRIRDGGIEPLGANARPEPPTALSEAATSVAESCFLPDVRLILSEAGPSGTDPTSVRDVWHHETGTYQGAWAPPFATIRAMGVVSTSGGAPQTLMIGSSDYNGALAVEGYVYYFESFNSNPTTWDNGLGLGGTPSARFLRTVVGDDLEVDQCFNMVTAEVFNGFDETSVTYVLGVTTTIESDSGSSASLTGFAATTFDTDRVAWGINAHGRRLVVTITCAVAAAPLVRIGRIKVHRSLLGYNPNGF